MLAASRFPGTDVPCTDVPCTDVFPVFAICVRTSIRIAPTALCSGFGFVTFEDAAVCDTVIAAGPHELGGRTIEPKPATKRGPDPRAKAATAYDTGGNFGKKIFAGGLPANATEESLKEFFST